MKAGITSPASWNPSAVSVSAQAGSAAQPVMAVEAKAEPIDAQGFDLHPPVVLMKGTHEPSFFISWRSQREVIGSLGWKSALMIWGGPALAIACIYVLIMYFSRL
jgi:hypothetical protein